MGRGTHHQISLVRVFVVFLLALVTGKIVHSSKGLVYHNYMLLVSCNSNNYVVCRLIYIINLFEYHHCQAITTS